jgi:hypothetical protein
MSAKYVFEWTFSPPDYFEETIHIERDDYEMWIDMGEVKAEVKEEHYGEQMRDQLHESLNDRFLGVQLLTHQLYELSRPSMSKLHPDGGRDLFIQLESGVLVTDGATVDFIVKDKNGNVVSDTRRERIEKKKSLAEMIEKYKGTDPVVDSFTTSYHNAVMDPDNELVHLYEIRDALQDKFNGSKAARNNIGVSRSEWSRLGYLANEAPIKQGRHRGQQVGALRDATNDELNEARNIARNMILAYIDHLERRP